MRRELGIARCGLACCLCTENADCNGCDSNSCPDNDFCENKKCSIAKELTHCYKCEETCKKGLLSKIKPYTFNLFAKKCLRLSLALHLSLQLSECIDITE